jgi:hypothetical protein
MEVAVFCFYWGNWLANIGVLSCVRYSFNLSLCRREALKLASFPSRSKNTYAGEAGEVGGVRKVFVSNI